MFEDEEYSSSATEGGMRERHFTTDSVPSALTRSSLIEVLNKGRMWWFSSADTLPKELERYRARAHALTDADDQEIMACTTDWDTLAATTIPRLKDMLRALGAKISGQKNILIGRVVEERRKAYEAFAGMGKSGWEASAKRIKDEVAEKRRGRPNKAKEGENRVRKKKKKRVRKKKKRAGATKLSARLKMEDVDTAVWFADATADDLATLKLRVTDLARRGMFFRKHPQVGEEGPEALLLERLTNFGRGTIADWQEFGERKEEILALLDAAVKEFLDSESMVVPHALLPEADADLPLAVRNARRLGFDLGSAGEDGADPSDVREALKPVASGVAVALNSLWSSNPDTQATLNAIRLHRIPLCRWKGSNNHSFFRWFAANDGSDFRSVLIQFWRGTVGRHAARAPIFRPEDCVQ